MMAHLITLKPVLLGTGILTMLACDGGSNQEKPGSDSEQTEIPHISYVGMSERQPHESDEACIWYEKSTKGEWSAWSRWHQPFKVSGS